MRGSHQVWGISETCDQNSRSNARPRLRLADLLTEIVIHNCDTVLSDRNLIIGLSFWPVSADSINLYSDAFGLRGEKLNSKQTKFSGKSHQIEPSSDGYPYFFLTIFTSILSLIGGRGSDGSIFIGNLLFVCCNVSESMAPTRKRRDMW